MATGIDFNENDYLRANPDVAAAVEAGHFASGLAHFNQCGKAEGRIFTEPTPPGMFAKIRGVLSRASCIPRRALAGIHTGSTSREEKILSAIDKRLPGLEIGPSHRPVAPKKSGFNVKILDHLDTAGLRDKYRSHGVDVEAIEEVDYVWSGESLSTLVDDRKFDWIIASHVIEHTPDLIGFLNECEKILSDTGVLSLAVPDKRYCFDHFRETTSLSRVVDANFLKLTNHTPGTAADYYLNVCKKRGGHCLVTQAWWRI